MWTCCECERTFDEPVVKAYRENLDGENGWWEYTEAHCPYCGSEFIDETFEEYFDGGDDDGD